MKKTRIPHAGWLSIMLVVAKVAILIVFSVVGPNCTFTGNL